MKKILSLLIVFLLTASSAFPASLEVDYFENATNLAMQEAYVTNGTLIKAIGTTSAGTANFSTGFVRYNKFTADFSTSVTSMKVYCAVNSNVRVAIYADNAGTPGTLLNESASVAITAGDWRSVTIPTTSIVSGTVYWLAAQPETLGGITYVAETNLGYGYEAQAYGAFPANATLTDLRTDIHGAMYGLGLSLQSYSEASIKTQGSYALKVVAAITDSLNKTLTRTATIGDLTGVKNLKFDIRASRTGSNIKIGIVDTGATTEITPNIITADTYQTVNWDISGVSDANKNAITATVVTVTNADAANTFYVDYFEIAQAIDIFGWVN